MQNTSGNSVETIRFGVLGMTCDKCAAAVERALRAVSGVQTAKVDRASALATVTFEASKTDVPALHAAVSKAGYRPSPLSPS